MKSWIKRGLIPIGAVAIAAATIAAAGPNSGFMRQISRFYGLQRYESIITDGIEHYAGIAIPPNGADPHQSALVVTLSPNQADPCANAAWLKQSAVINITTATTTNLVNGAAGRSIFACSFNFSISEVITTANTLVFEYGTGPTCSTPTALTGLFGGGGVIAGIPIVVAANGEGTLFTAPAGNNLCALTVIGASGSFQGVLTFVQK